MTLLPQINLPGHRVSTLMIISDFKHRHPVFTEAESITLTADRVKHCVPRTGGIPGHLQTAQM